ncbi:MAG TPA: helix-turn-helix transcriptional regulator [Streptosporangiaceae bacterium]
MPDHDRQALHDFIEQLATLREDAGGPSLPALRRLSEQARPHAGRAPRVLAESTTHEILCHKRKRWPEWEWVASFVSACLLFAQDAAGVDARQLGDLGQWRSRFLAARTSDRAGSVTPMAPATRSPGLDHRGLDHRGFDHPSLDHADRRTRPLPRAAGYPAAVPRPPDFGTAARLTTFSGLADAGPVPGRPLAVPGSGSAGARAMGSVWAAGAVAARPDEAPEPQRGGPRVVQMMLATRLHRLREERCITHTDAAQAIQVSPAKIGEIESGRVSVKEPEVAGLLALYGVTAAERTALLSLVHQANTPGWWHTYDALLPDWFETYLGLEEAASRLRTYAIQFIPELLQTPDYARAVLRLRNPDVSAEEIERRVSLRMRRQQLLTRPAPLRLWAVVDEMALLRKLGGAAVMRAQLRRLIEATTLPNVTLNALPLRAGGSAAVTGPFSILRFTEPELPDVIYIEQLTGAIFLDERDDLDSYAVVMETLCANAANPTESVRMIRTLLDEM